MWMFAENKNDEEDVADIVIVFKSRNWLVIPSLGV